MSVCACCGQVIPVMSATTAVVNAAAAVPLYSNWNWSMGNACAGAALTSVVYLHFNQNGADG